MPGYAPSAVAATINWGDGSSAAATANAAQPLLSDGLAGYRQYLTAARHSLIRGHRLRGRPLQRARAATGHALAYSTWQSLTQDQDLDDRQAAELMSLLVTAAARPDTLADQPLDSDSTNTAAEAGDVADGADHGGGPDEAGAEDSGQGGA